jgi:hypothetical protein
MIAEAGAYLRIKEISAGDEFSEETEASRVDIPQFGEEFRGAFTVGRRQQLFQTGRKVRADREYFVEALTGHASFTRGRKAIASRDENVSQAG